MRNTARTLAAALLTSVLITTAHAADSVKIGVILPLSGNAAGAGNAAARAPAHCRAASGRCSRLAAP